MLQGSEESLTKLERSKEFSEIRPVSEDDLMETVSHPGLAPGESYTFPAKVVIVSPLVLPGWQYFGILVDNTNVVAEANEDNNWKNRHVLIVPL